MSKEIEKHYHWVMTLIIIFLLLAIIYLNIQVNNLWAEVNTHAQLSQPVEVAYPGAHFECMNYENITRFKVNQPFFTSDCGSIIFDYCNKFVSEQLNCDKPRCPWDEFKKQNDDCNHEFMPVIGRQAGGVNWMRIPYELGIKLIQGCITNLTMENVTEQICTKEVLVRDNIVANSASEAIYYG